MVAIAIPLRQANDTGIARLVIGNGADLNPSVSVCLGARYSAVLRPACSAAKLHPLASFSYPTRARRHDGLQLLQRRRRFHCPGSPGLLGVGGSSVTQPAWGKVQHQQQQRGGGLSVFVVAAGGEPQFATEEERQGWLKRQSESGGGGGGSGGGGGFGEWRWTLNWNAIQPNLLVGSCPRSAGDIDRIADEAGATAIVNLQSDVCFDALQIPFAEIRQRAVERGVLLERVPVRDFDHGDQAFMLPEAVRMINLLLARGLVVYVHCTAGINRASLSVLGHMTFVQGMDLDTALAKLRAARPIVHPYLDCWHVVKAKLLEGRHEEQMALAAEIYKNRATSGSNGDATSDWKQAQARVMSDQFKRFLEVDLAKLEGEEAMRQTLQVQRLTQLMHQHQHAAAEAAAEADELERQAAAQGHELVLLEMNVLQQQLAAQLAASRSLRTRSRGAGTLLGQPKATVVVDDIESAAHGGAPPAATAAASGST